MGDDIVERLQCIYADPPCEQCTFCAARAEIERLRAELDHHVDSVVERDAEIERLRAAGDALAEAVDDTWWPDYPCDFPDLLAAWKQARRG